jgi:predicted TIM-barrel fold metal-dependent hydrolase
MDRTMAGVYPGAYDPQARLEDMARDHVDAEVLYPSVAMRIFALEDRALVRACFRAYNDWIARFCKANPAIFKGIGMIDLDDIESAVGETHRAKRLGLAGLMITIASNDPTLYGTTAYDPFWAAAEALAMPVSVHIVTDKKPIKFDRTSETLSAVEAMRTLANMVFGGLFLRFPKLRVVSAENDAGWAGYFVEKMDYLFQDQVRTMIRDYPIKGKGMLPSEYMRRNVALTFIYDRSGVEARHWFGVENLMWSSDYPHNASTWPKSQEVLDYLFKGVPRAERQLMVAGNAARTYSFA